MSADDAIRFSRQTILPEVGVEGQQKLADARVLVVGLGGLGSPVATYLAAAGVGTLGLVDDDAVDLSNLHRQPLHGTRDLGRPKLQSAAETLTDLYPKINLELHETRLASSNALEIIDRYDIVADGTDNFSTRFLVNDACVMLGKPNVYASIYRFEGQVSVFAASKGPCYRCLFPEPPPAGTVPNCAEAGVLGALPGVAGTLQATEVLKLILGVGEPMVGRFLIFDLLGMSFQDFRVEKDPDCPVCSNHPTITALEDLPDGCVVVPEIAPEDLRKLIREGTPPVLLDVREDEELEWAAIEGFLHIPLADLEERAGEIPADADLVAYCHSGARSAAAVDWLRKNGHPRARNLRGGIQAYLQAR
ncbi:MAG TPA: molybdopterin-synthase adenylyltransferase MoeB [Fimbriimonas sp.]